MFFYFFILVKRLMETIKKLCKIHKMNFYRSLCTLCFIYVLRRGNYIKTYQKKNIV